MKVSILINNLNRNTIILQPWNYAYRIADALVSHGDEVTLFTNNQEGTHSLSTLNKINLQTLPISNLRFIDRNSLKIIEREKPNVIYWFGNSLSGIYVKRAKLLKIPVVLHISSMHYSFSELTLLSLHEMLSNWMQIVAATPLGTFMLSYLNDNAISVITVPNKAIKVRLTERGVLKNKIKVTPLTFKAKSLIIKDEKTMLGVRGELGLEKKRFIVLYLGSPNPIRGADVLIHSAKMLKSKLINIQIIILSRRDEKEDNKDEKHLSQLIRKYRLGDTVKIIPGMLKREVVKSYLLASDVVVLPFKIVPSEPNIAILEAMALGKPVVTTKICGLPELIRPGKGFLVRPGDANEIAKVLTCLSNNPEILIKIGQQARDFVNGLSGWNRLGEWTSEVLYQATKSYKI